MTLIAALAPLFTLAFLTAATAALPWTFRESRLLRPIYAEPLLRYAMIGLVYAAMIPALALAAAGILRGLTLRLPNPEGKRLEKNEAPRLYRMLAEMARSLDTCAVEEVRVSPKRVLGILHEPCGGLGILGGPKTILVIGLPAAEELSPQQFRALVAHELAHLATHKRRLGGRLLGLRRRLGSLRQAAEASALERGFWSRLPDESLVSMLHTMIRRLTAITFSSVRQHEAEADAISAAVAGRDFAASALLRQRLAGHAVSNQFEEMCLRLAESSAELPPDLFERRTQMARGAIGEAQVNAWLREEMQAKDDLTESHPPLWERLRLLGFRLETMVDFREMMEQVQPHCELGETAARYFLGECWELLRKEFYADWAAHKAADWRKRFAVYKSLRMTAAEWDRGEAAAETDPAALWQFAVAVGNTRGWREAVPAALRVLEISPEHADANLLTGQLQLEDGNPAGIEALERAMKSDPRMVPLACATAARFLEGRGEREAAGNYQERGEEYWRQEQKTARERSQVRASDEFVGPDCPTATVQSLLRAVERHSSHLRRAYLIRKRTADVDQRPLYVLGVERRSVPYENVALANRMLLERIMRSPGMAADILVCVVTRANRALLTKWQETPNSLLYARKRELWSGAAAARAQAENLLRQPAATLPARGSPAAAK